MSAGVALFGADLFGSDPALTIYNQNFAIVRETVPLDLQAGINRIRYTGITARVEPDSVILRDPSGKIVLRILEQNYQSEPVSMYLLLALYEGKTIEFQKNDGKIVSGKIIRVGLVPRPASGLYAASNAVSYGPGSQTIVEIDGKLRFDLPGVPLFPALADGAVLKPTIDWSIRADGASKLNAELGYVSTGLNWKADYNIVAPEQDDRVEISGWVTIENQSGKTFSNARIALMAGEVNKQQPGQLNSFARLGGGVAGSGYAGSPGPPVVEKPFDDYHLYTLQNATTLQDRESKQVEFIRALNVATNRIYVYDGAKIDGSRYPNWNYDAIRGNPEYGAASNPKVWIMREFVNSEANRLGMPLPKGNVRFYRRDQSGQIEFTGENEIGHTPKGETVQVYTGTAFDVVGERRRTDYQINHQNRTVDETFEIKLRNHKQTPLEVRVVERLYRGFSWKIAIETDQHRDKDSQTIEYRITVKPEEERVVKYSAHYTW